MAAFYELLVKNNKKWVETKIASNPNYFTEMAQGQNPKVFWIGCSDSRVPANEITGTNAGDMFVHRNIANMVVHTDINMLSVLDYAVNVLKTRHIIVCGHYGCGGIKTAMSNAQVGIIDNWVRHIKDVYRFHEMELDKITDDKKRFDRFVELNVVEQVFDLAKTSIVQNAWASGQVVWVHGWVYSLETGLIKDLDITFKDNSSLNTIHRLDI